MSLVRIDSLSIQSPKRVSRREHGWDRFFPYYAGYPESFARTLLESAKLSDGAVVLDPWNGSGTTTFAASQLGLSSCGFDLNPVMVIIARARLLPPFEADSLDPLARDAVKALQADPQLVEQGDPLLWWFDHPSASLIRSLEHRIRELVVGGRTITFDGVKLENISGIAATFYVALFLVCRRLGASYQSSNPTWLRRPTGEERISVGRDVLIPAFTDILAEMAQALAIRAEPGQLEQANVDLYPADTTATVLDEATIDMVLTSPPYCTRIDYAAATRIELAVLYPLVRLKMEDLGRCMMGSTRVPQHSINISDKWGTTCLKFLTKLRAHRSKASDGYYFKTHLDYFDKMSRSLTNITHGLKRGGAAVLVLQDSYYKDIHNNLPSIAAEMAAGEGLALRRREDFHFNRSMAGINPKSRTYQRGTGVVESVLCFEKS